jgi:hypothetical protein
MLPTPPITVSVGCFICMWVGHPAAGIIFVPERHSVVCRLASVNVEGRLYYAKRSFVALLKSIQTHYGLQILKLGILIELVRAQCRASTNSAMVVENHVWRFPCAGLYVCHKKWHSSQERPVSGTIWNIMWNPEGTVVGELVDDRISDWWRLTKSTVFCVIWIPATLFR